MPDIVNRVIMKVEGEEEIARLNEELESAQKWLSQLLQNQKQGGVTFLNSEQIRQTAMEIDGLEKQLAKLKGTRGFDGTGLLGASWAFQDFMSVLTMGGGFERAMMSVSNNVDGMARAMGMAVDKAAGLSLAFTGFTAALPLLMPAFKAMWESVAGAGVLEDTKAKLKDLEEDLKRFQALREQPMEFEAMSMEALKKVTAGPAAAKMMDDVVKAMMATGTGAVAEQPWFERLRGMIGIGPLGTAIAALAPTEAEQAEKMRQANLQEAKRMVAGLTAPTREKREESLTFIRALAEQRPDLFPQNMAARLAEMTPEALEAQEREGEAAIAEGEDFAERAKTGVQGRRDAARAKKRDNAAIDAQNLLGENYQQQGEREQETQQKRDLDKHEQEARKRIREQERQRLAAPREEAEAVAPQLIQALPEAVGARYGPGAGQMVGAAIQRATPAEIAEMEQQATQNILGSQGQYEAALNAFERVYRASQVKAQQDRQWDQRFRMAPNMGGWWGG